MYSPSFSPFPSLRYHISGKGVEVCGSGSRHHQLCCCCDLQLIQSPVVPSHGPPARILSPLFFQAKSLLLPKPCGKREHPKATWSPLCQSCVVFSPFSTKAEWSSLLSSKTAWSSLFSYNQLHLPAFPILPALLGCHSKSG